jgi:hypothetical protein
MEWHHPTSPWRKKFKVTPSAGKVMATIFSDAEGVIFGKHYAMSLNH